LNRSRTSTLRTKLRRCREAFLHGTVEEAEQACVVAFKALDREANRRTIHRNQAARRKSRMATRLNAMRAKAAAQ
jgi:small subunit ribosomal protein S20